MKSKRAIAAIPLILLAGVLVGLAILQRPDSNELVSTNANPSTLATSNREPNTIVENADPAERDPEPHPTQIEVVAPYESARFNMGSATLVDVQSRYYSNIGRAREGDVNAMLLVADLIWNCYYAHVSNGAEGAWELYEQGIYTHSEYEELIGQIDQCQPILDEVYANNPVTPKSDAFTIEVHKWRQASAAGGNQVAQLQLAMRPTGDWYEAARLADELVDSKDHRVLYAAADLIAKVTDPADIENYKWRYLACLHHPECSDDAYQNNMEIALTQSERQQILDFADAFESNHARDFTFSSILMDRYGGAEIPSEEKYIQSLIDEQVAQAEDPAEL